MAHIAFPHIEAERARLGLSKAELSRLIGVSARTYYNWQSGHSDIPRRKLEFLAKAFGVTTDYLLGIK